jgi:hypothetical protein
MHLALARAEVRDRSLDISLLPARPAGLSRCSGQLVARILADLRIGIDTRTARPPRPRPSPARSPASRAEPLVGAGRAGQGSFGVQETGGAQFWPLTGPAATPSFAAQLGMPGGAQQVDWIMGGTLRAGAAAVTRAAPGLRTNAGGALEVVVQPGGVSSFWFHMP